MPSKQVGAQRPSTEKPYKGGSASSWVKDRIVTEAMDAASARVSEESRQLTVRLHPVIAALFEGFAERFKMSRNNAANVLLACALVDAVATLPKAERDALLKKVEDLLGRPLDLSPPPPAEFAPFKMGNPFRDLIEDIKGMFR